jgi:hypothetical protein
MIMIMILIMVNANDVRMTGRERKGMGRNALGNPSHLPGTYGKTSPQKSVALARNSGMYAL